MSLKLYYHPLSSFCHKALIALYEGGVPFEPVAVDLSNEESSAPLRALWPVAKFPVLRDEARGQTVAEATVIIEYLDAHYGTKFCRPAPTKPGKRECGIASTISIFIPRCKRWLATNCVLPARKIPSASSRRGS